MVAKMLSLVAALFCVTAHAELNASTIERISPLTFLAATISGNTSELEASPPSAAQSLDMTSAAMESAITDLMFGKSKFGATPMGGSVKTITKLLTHTMMPKVVAAHKADQANLIRLNNDIKKCGSTKASGLKKAKPSSNSYKSYSRHHQTCRGEQAVAYSSKNTCLSQQRAAHNVKQLRCKYFATVSKQYGTQKANAAIVKKAGSEKTEQYIIRLSHTICGNHIHGDKGNKPGKGGWGGGLPNSMLDKYLKAKEACEQAKRDYNTKVKECKRKYHAYNVKRAKCNQYQGLMDQNSCKAAVLVKDACESYAECYYAKKKAYQVFLRKATSEETDRKAEWRGLKRMECLMKAFSDGKVTGSEVDSCKKKAHSTSHLNLKYPRIPPLEKCTVPNLYPSTGAYKRKEFAPLPTLAKGVASQPCSGVESMPTTPRAGSPKGATCRRVMLNGYYSPGGLVKCQNGLDVYKSQQKNSCPRGTKIFSPTSRSDWRTFLASADPLRAPHWIIDVTRPSNGCGGCTRPMNSANRQQKSWQTSDGSSWWLRSTGYNEPNGDYTANCYLELWHGRPRNENYVAFNDGRCNYHSKSYYCQPVNLHLQPKAGSPKSCQCSKVDLTAKYTAGALVKCEQCITVYKSTQKNSCPKGMKLFSPASRDDWKTFLNSAGPLRAPNFIVDITRPQNSCGGCTKYSMKSSSPQQATWRTSDGSPWWLRSTRWNEPNGDYTGNCFLDISGNPNSPDTLHFNDHNCNYRSRSYYCQPTRNDPNYGGHHRRRRAGPVAKPKKLVKPKPKAIKVPVGVVLNYDQSSLFKAGWKDWSDKKYSHHTTKKDIQPVSGECVMWGSKKSAGSTHLAVAAFGRRKVIENKKAVWENGVYWYTQPDTYRKGAGSVGFSANDKIRLSSADTENSKGAYRLSWHLHAKGHVGGYRSGTKTGLNSDNTWRKVVMYGPCKGVKKGKR